MAQILDAPSIVRAMALYAQALERFRPELDSLNVFPVADGDTGSNLLHTQRAVVAALEALGNDAGMRGVRETIATSALAGARGNSGVILSQVLRTLCAVVPDDGADGPALAKALAEAAAAARRAVAEPKEGTVLTVLDGAAAAAQKSATSSSAGAALEAALSGARRALERTTDLLPELRDAEVVDAGGKGTVLLLDALRAAVTGHELSEPSGPAGPVGRAASPGAVRARPSFSSEVEFLLEASDGSVADLRRQLSALGDSLAVVGGDGLYRVHVHTGRPDDVLEAGRAAGAVGDPAVTSLDDQVADCLGGAARGVQAGRAACALVAVVEESGVADALRSFGAVVVEPSGDGGAVRRRLETAVASTAADGAVVLCSLPLADDVRPMLPTLPTDGHVVAAQNLPAVISAAAEYHPDASPPVNAAAMAAAAARCRIADIPIAPAEVATAAAEATALVAALVSETRDAEVLTLVAGAAVPDADAAAFVAAIERRFPQLRVEHLRGGPGEPAYQFGLD